MNYVRRAGRFVRKKITGGHHSHGHHRQPNVCEASSATSTSHGTNSSLPSNLNGHSWNGHDPVQYIHNDAVSSVAAVGKNLCLSGGKDNIVALFDYQQRVVDAKWNGHSKEVTKVLPGQNGLYFSGSRDKTIRSWRSGSPSSLQTYRGHEFVVTAMDISRDYESFCSGSRDNSLKLWDIQTASCVRSVSIPRNLVTDLKFGHDRPIVVQSSEDKEIHLWDSRNLSVIQTFRKKQYIQTACDLDKDDMYCLSSSNGFGGNGCEATLWDLRATEPVLEYRGHHESVGACAFIPPMAGRDLVMTSSQDSTVRVWDKHSAACLACLSIPGSGPLTSISVGPQNTFLVSSFNRGILRLRLTDNNGQLTLDILDVF